ncbi:hypothetical protein HXX01_04135 [Candidatus Nomurabacteria bacterium]|nr:hypothetical protein [Candidatus Nomurabacteria bacterium]
MKFFRNIIFICVGTILLFYVVLRLAEVSRGNALYYILPVIGGLIVFISKILMDLNLFSSLKKDLEATPEELTQKSIKMEKYYVGEMILSFVGVAFLYYGYNEYLLSGLSKISGFYFLLGLACFVTIIKSLTTKETKIKNLSNINVNDKEKFKKTQKIVFYIVIALIILSYLEKLF